MKKYDVNSKIEAYTLAFYNEMIKEEKDREFYRIAYYLYFLKKNDLYLFDNEYYQTRTGIVWPDNDELMFKLITQEQKPREQIDPVLLNDRDNILVNNVYNKYKGDSLPKLKELVLDDIKAMKIFEDCELKQQMDIAFKKYKKYYDQKPMEALALLDEVFKKTDVTVYNTPKRVKIFKKR